MQQILSWTNEQSDSRILVGAGFRSQGHFLISTKQNFKTSHIQLGTCNIMLAPTSMSRCIGRCQHWVPTLSVGTYQYV